MNITREKPHFLFISEKWCDTNPAAGETNSVHSFWGHLEATGFGTYELFHFDEFYQKNGYAGDQSLIHKCIETQPDFVFLLWIWSEKTYNNPQLETLHTIRTRLNIPIVNWWGDVDSSCNMTLANLIAPYVDLILAGDSTCAYQAQVDDPSKFYFLNHPKDPRIFCDAGLRRDIDISLMGGVQGRAERISSLEALSKHGFQVVQAGGQREHLLSIQEYARTIQRSKISFNETRPSMINGKILEIPLCGALLLDHERSGASRLLIPGEDYVQYSDDTDLVQKAHYYLTHPEERERIAANGHEKIKKLCSNDSFWRKIVELVSSNNHFNPAQAHTALAKRSINLGNHEYGFALLNEAINLNPNYAESFRVLASHLVAQDKNLEGIWAYKKAIQVDSNNTDSVVALSKTYRKIDQLEASRELIECSMARLNQAGFPVQALVQEYAELLVEMKDWDSVQKVYAQDIANSTDNLLALLGLARGCLNIGNKGIAEQIIFNVKGRNITDRKVNQELSDLLEMAGHPYEAAKHRWSASCPPEPRGFWDVINFLMKYEYTGERSKQFELLKEQTIYAKEEDLKKYYRAFARHFPHQLSHLT